MLSTDQLDLRWLAELDPDEFEALRGSLDGFLAVDQLQDYKAYPKQAEFHHLGVRYRNRLLMANNQGGKTYSASAEVAFHLTGEYPKWWKGKRFTQPITCWVSSETGESTRDNCQRMLIGLPKQEGTGMIPRRCLTAMYGKNSAVSDLYDYIYVRHVSGGLSLLKFRFYTQERRAWQGPPVDVVWFDEEPPEDKYYEGLARTIATQGITLMTFTPLLGFTKVVNLYLKDPEPEVSGRVHVRMTIHDSLHLTEEEKQAEIARWPAHQRRARIEGLPAIGEGLIYPYGRDELAVTPFEVPEHFLQLGAIDPGGSSLHSHPTGAVKLVYDREDDIVYVTREHRRVGLKPGEHWLVLKHWGRELKWAWPRDSLIEEKASGDQIIALYKDEGMKAVNVFAQWPVDRRKSRGRSTASASTGGIVSVERGILEIMRRIEGGRLKIFETCSMLFEEFGQYHRKDGDIVKVNDDLLDALRYGIMMLRYADVAKAPKVRLPELVDAYLGM